MVREWTAWAKREIVNKCLNADDADTQSSDCRTLGCKKGEKFHICIQKFGNVHCIILRFRVGIKIISLFHLREIMGDGIVIR
jgi:hypothetical protein